jgi:NitT/TauT family transport system substrate-binding protein
VNIAQIYQRSGTLQVSFADSGITSPEDFAGKKIGNWGFGNEYEVFAALTQAGLDPATDVELVGQSFDMVALLEGEIDAAEAMTYNEYAQVLEADQPRDRRAVPAGGLQRDLVRRGRRRHVAGRDLGRRREARERRDLPRHRDPVRRRVDAGLGVLPRQRPGVCADIVLAAGPTLGASHQLWQMNEVNKLIWPSSSGIGFIDQAAWDRTVEISQNTPNLEGATVLTAPPTDGAFTNDIVEAAWALLADAGLDLFGEDYAPIEVTLNEGGA